MKYPFLFILLWIALVKVNGQAPQAIKYQAIARDASGSVLNNQSITVRLSIHEGTASGTVIYQETHAVTTNPFGLFNLNIGEGTVITGNFAEIDWSTGNKYIEQEINLGSGYLSLGTSQFLSVPYALYAASGNPGPAGANGISISWLGTMPTAPSDPSLNQAYYNSTDKKSYIYDGSTWNTLAEDGIAGSDGSTILSGIADPTSGIGRTGDFYLKTTTSRLYGPKTAQGSWGAGVSLIGPQGQPGSANITGTSNYIIKFTGETSGGNSQLFDNGTNVGIGTATPSEKLHVEGNIVIPSANDYKFSSSKTKYKSVAPAAFTLASAVSTTAFVGGSSNGSYRCIAGGTSGAAAYMFAPLDLPDGATIESVVFYIYDGDATYSLYGNIYRLNLATNIITNIANTNVSSGSPGNTTLTTGTISSVVDNSQYAYYLRYVASENTPNLRILGVKIQYSITKVE